MTDKQQRRKKTARELLDDRTIAVLDPWANERLQAFADADSEQQKIETLIDTLVYDSSDVPWYIAWGVFKDVDADPNNATTDLKPLLFNSADFRRKLRTFLSRARCLARRVHFCAYWCLDDDAMANWLKSYLIANPYDRSVMPPPFGVIEPSEAIFLKCQLAAAEMAGAGGRVPLTRLEVEWYPLLSAQQQQANDARDGEVMPRNVKVHVFEDRQLCLVHPHEAVSRAYRNSAVTSGSKAPVLDRARDRFSAAVEGTLPFLLPNSPVFNLMQLKAELVEAKSNRRQAEAVLIQPNVLIEVAPTKIDRAAVTNAAPNDLAFTDGTSALMLNERHEVQTYTAQEWMKRAEALDGLIHPASLYDSQTPSSSTRHRLVYDRPHPLETMWPLLEGTRVAYVHKPTTLIDVELLDERYRQAVAEAAGLSLAILQQILGTGSGSAGKNGAAGDNFGNIYATPYETPAERHLHHMLQTERNWIGDFFANVYTNMMHTLDIRELEAINRHLQDRQSNMREAKLAARVLENMLMHEMEGFDAVDTALVSRRYAEQKERAGDKDARKSTRGNIRYYRELLDRLRVCYDSTARIIFQPGTSKRTAMLLQVALSELYDRGLVGPAVIDKLAKPILGEDVTLERNPVPPLLPGTSLSPADELQAATTTAVAKAKDPTVSAPPKKRKAPDTPSSSEPAKKKQKKKAE